MKTQIIKYALILLFSTLTISCLEERSTLENPTHPTDWLNKTSDIFHGDFVNESLSSSENCQTCHGEDLSGGNSNVSCFNSQCHTTYPHPIGFADPTAPEFHSSIIKELKWDIVQCQSCHGSGYEGAGLEEKNCLKCHTQVDGPEACNTCHGDFKNSAPPQDLSDNVSTDFVGVGAHQAHFDTTWTTAFIRDCNICHVEPSTLNSPGHIDDSSPFAEINFNSFASDSGRVNPVWNHETATCSNIYCHGAFTFDKDPTNFATSWVYLDSVISGNDTTMVWNSVGNGQAECGTCHGLQPKGHQPLPACENCHNSVVGRVGEELKIINKKLHINGKIDLNL